MNPLKTVDDTQASDNTIQSNLHDRSSPWSVSDDSF